MRDLLRALTRRMVVKIFLAVALVTGEALVLLAWRQNANEIRALREGIRTSAGRVADAIGDGNLDVIVRSARPDGSGAA